MNFPVIHNGEEVGVVHLEEDGLYVKLHCQCTNVGGGFHRLYGKSGDKRVNLGLLILNNGSYILDKKISKRSICEGIKEFLVISDREVQESCTVQLHAGESVTNLETIVRWKLRLQDGCVFMDINS